MKHHGFHKYCKRKLAIGRALTYQTKNELAFFAKPALQQEPGECECNTKYILTLNYHVPFKHTQRLAFREKNLMYGTLKYLINEHKKVSNKRTLWNFEEKE